MLILESYLDAIVKEDQRLVKVYDHLNSLVLTEIASTTAQIKDQVGRLTLCTESMNFHVQTLSDEMRKVLSLRSDLVDRPARKRSM